MRWNTSRTYYHRVVRALLLIALAACGGRSVVEAPPAIPPLGITLSIYIGAHVTAGFVDDRRTIEVNAGSVVIPQVSADANFSSFVVEPVDGKPLVVTHCGRERIGKEPKDEAHCAVSGAQGTRIVRVMYALGYAEVQSHHRLNLAADGTGSLVTEITLSTPTWDRDADVRIYDGEVSEPRKALPLAQAKVPLDGQDAVITPPARTIRSRLRTIFANDPASVTPDEVAVWAELAVEHLVAGDIAVTVAHDGIVSPELVVTDEQRHVVASHLSLPLWTEQAITAVRSETQVQRTDRATEMRYTVAFTNPLGTSRDVWIYHFADEHRVALRSGTPGTPTFGNGILRMMVTVPPNGTTRAEYVLAYLP